ncbi:MAG: class I SAM-dependent methyltransferase [Terriglobales bacterium]
MALAISEPDHRYPSAGLDADFQRLCAEPSDINEHMPLLRALAARCEHVTEFGVRYGLSTVAFLAAQPKTLISWDINIAAILSPNVASLGNSRGRTDFQPRVGDSLKVEIEETDLLFIDSLHTGRQLQGELRKHGRKARKFIVLHDTESFGEVGEDGSVPGLVYVIRTWRRNECLPLFRPVLRLVNNNGVAVLQRESDVEKNGAFEWAGGVRYGVK